MRFLAIFFGLTLIIGCTKHIQIMSAEIIGRDNKELTLLVTTDLDLDSYSENLYTKEFSLRYQIEKENPPKEKFDIDNFFEQYPYFALRVEESVSGVINSKKTNVTNWKISIKDEANIGLDHRSYDLLSRKDNYIVIRLYGPKLSGYVISQPYIIKVSNLKNLTE